MQYRINILTSSHFTTQNQSPAEMLSASNSVGHIFIRIKTHQDPRALAINVMQKQKSKVYKGYQPLGKAHNSKKVIIDY